MLATLPVPSIYFPNHAAKKNWLYWRSWYDGFWIKIINDLFPVLKQYLSLFWFLLNFENQFTYTKFVNRNTGPIGLII